MVRYLLAIQGRFAFSDAEVLLEFLRFWLKIVYPALISIKPLHSRLRSHYVLKNLGERSEKLRSSQERSRNRLRRDMVSMHGPEGSGQTLNMLKKRRSEDVVQFVRGKNRIRT
jgi:hypothetical protein